MNLKTIKKKNKKKTFILKVFFVCKNYFFLLFLNMFIKMYAPKRTTIDTIKMTYIIPIETDQSKNFGEQSSDAFKLSTTAVGIP